MIAQDKASDKGISSNKIEVKGNIILAKYFVYIEVYDFSVSEDEQIKMKDGSKTTQNVYDPVNAPCGRFSLSVQNEIVSCDLWSNSARAEQTSAVITATETEEDPF
jgi:hypothetical protein